MNMQNDIFHGTVRALLDEKGREVFTTEPGITASEAVTKMNEHDVGALIVTRGDKPIGIFTERDVLRKLVGHGLNAESTTVEKLMSTDLIVVNEQVTVGEAMAIITRKKSRHLPVVEKGRLVGMVSIGDLTSYVTRAQEIQIRDLTDYILGTYPV